jgi:hypothetical protein
LRTTNAPSSTTPPAQSAPSPGGPSGPKASFKISSAFSDAIALVRSPTGFMNANRDNDPSIQTLMINYVAVLAAVPFVATLIGDLWYYSFIGRIVGFGALGIGFGLVAGILTYILDVVGVFVVGFVMWKLGPSFGTTTTQVRATRLAAYIFTPFFLASIFDIVPFLSVIALLGLLYGLYILYLGMPILLNTPKDKVITYAIVTVVVTFVVYAIIGAIIAAIAVAFIGAFIFF